MEQNHITTQFNLITRIIEKRQKELSTFDELIKARFVEMFGDAKFNKFAMKEGW
jgi:type I restriction enzyme S subunit